MNKPALISARNLVKNYMMGEIVVHALNDVSFEIKEGEFVVILGPSGSGKSTLLNLLGGMDNASSGRLFVGEKDVTALKDRELTSYRADDVGFVFQFYNLIPSLTAQENVALTADVAKHALPAEEVLNSVGLSGHTQKFPAELSGGEQQRVSIARAIAKDPRLLLCDEPTGALDSETGIAILGLLHSLCKQRGKTVVIVTHNHALARAADRVVRLKNGKVIETLVNECPTPMREVVW